MNAALKAYARIGIQTDIEEASPHRLVTMLFEGAREAVAAARVHMQHGAIGPKCEAVGKAIRIIEEGLMASLDTTRGGELAGRLAALYDYICRRLLLANLHNQHEGLDEVSRLLGELANAWAAIAPATR